jgi:hypothetical protein
MQTVSSQLTLFFKIFLPIFSLTFLGSMTLSLWFYDAAQSITTGLGVKMTATMLFLLVLFLVIRYTFPLKRVEMGNGVMHVTNYIKNFRYPFQDIDHIVVHDFGVLRMVHVHLKAAGSFGKKISFLASNRVFNKFMDENPKWYALIK